MDNQNKSPKKHRSENELAWQPASRAAQALGWIDAATGALIPPLHTATTYLREADNSYRAGLSYGRADNPSYLQAEALLTELEHGEESLLFASGMAAAQAVLQALRPGDHFIAPKIMYWSLRNWLRAFATRWGLHVDFVDMTDCTIVEQAIKPGMTKLIWVETPSNPLWSISDIAGLALLAKSCGAKLVVDSTAATPVLTQPILLGADIVMHSATKYLNGHSDVLAGSLTAAIADEPFWQTIKGNRIYAGGILGPFEAWLLLRGMRTLYIRVEQQSRSALTIAEQFTGHPAIERVLYPGLPDAPDHNLAAKQMTNGFGGMLSLLIRGDAAAAIGVAARVKLWQRATSLGGVESLIEHRASVEGENSPVPGNLLRLSVGLERPDDLIRDLAVALDG